MGIHLTINAEARQLPGPGPYSIEQLLALLEIKAPRVAVELNGAVVTRALHASTLLRDGDALEIVTFVGGG
jgi:sulfur carrier protein